MLFPGQAAHFPSLDWLRGNTRMARCAQIYCTVALASTMGFNSGGLGTLAFNTAFAALLLLLLARLADHAPSGNQPV